MRVCTHCGLSIGDTAAFCPVCCTPVGSNGASPPAKPLPAQPAFRSLCGQDELSRHLYDAAEQMHKANHCEKTDLTSAAALYRDAIVRFLDSTEDPLDREEVRRDLLFIFDRLSLVLKRNGLHKEALEEIESAVSLGLLDCRDYGIKGHCEALRKRRNSLQRTVAKASRDVT